MSRISARFTGTHGGFTLDATFDIPAQGITGLFGPSGCGKSTLLRCVAGLTHLPGSFLRVGAEVWQEGARMLPPYRRALGYVFQDARLFAHLSVRENLRFGQRRAGPGPVLEEEVVAFLGLAPLLARSPAALSGGERQRVAIGRALLAQPRLLLMDEPLSALDRDSAAEILPRLREISTRFGMPALYVSHQLDEIERIAAQMVFMQAGRVQAAGKLADLLGDLTLPFAARLGAATVLDLTVSAYDPAYELTLCGTPPLCLTVPGRLSPPGTPVRLRVLASDVSLLRQPAPSSIINVLPARILEMQSLDGPHMLVALAVGTARLLARITRKSAAELALAPGEEIYAQIKAEALDSAF